MNSPLILLSQSSSEFATDLYMAISERTKGEDLVISPFFLQSCIALTYAGSAGETAEALARALKLPEVSVLSIGKSFQHMLQKYSLNSNFQVASKIYFGSQVKLKSGFNKIVTKNYYSEIEQIDFSNTDTAAENVNKWVANKTSDKILNLVDANILNASTNMIIVNAIHFKGIWDKPFDLEDTEIRPFWISENESKEVDMMFQTAFFKYGVVEELNASALEMKYSHSDIWMLILLPNGHTDLSSMEEKLLAVDLLEISHNLTTKFINVSLPKFTVDCQMELQLPLTQLGMGSLFEKPNFSNMLEKDNIKVDKIIHKTFIEVTEEGSVAHSADIPVEFPRCSTAKPVNFTAEHPFFFAVKSKTAIFLTGRYVYS